MRRKIDLFSIVFAALMAALANVLGFLAVPGPWNIKFGLTGIPILIAGFVLGPLGGLIAGLVGGISQAVNYGSIWYIFYTAIQGVMAGYFIKHFKSLKLSSPIFGFLGGFFLILWLDLLRTGQHTFAQLTASNSGKTFDMHSFFGLPYLAISAGIVFGVVTLLSLFRAKERSFIHTAMAGVFAAIAYVPYDAFVLYKIQSYPWIPTWFVLSKDLVQDFIAAFVCAWIYNTPRIQKVLASRETP
jgi:uncharacterized membrane protein